MRLREILPLLTTFNVVLVHVYGEAVEEDGGYKDNIIAEVELDGNEQEILDQFGNTTVTDIWATEADNVTVFCI